MPNDNLKAQNWTNGQGITAADLNGTARFGIPRLLDAFLEKLIPGPHGYAGIESNPLMQIGGLHGDNAPTGGWAYAIHGGSAYPRQGSGNDKIQIAPGTLLQKVGARTGDEASLLAYTFTGTEEVTIAAGDATNPRIDLVEMKLEWETGNAVSRDFKDSTNGALSTTTPSIHRRVLCTIQVKTGTPAASPAYPLPTAGFVPIAGVFVPQTWAAASPILIEDSNATTSLVLHDQRIPLCARAYRSIPRDWFVDTSAGVYALETRGRYVTAGATPSDIYALCPSPSRVGRVLGLKCYSNGATGVSAAIALKRFRDTNAGIALQDLNTLTLFSAGATWLNLGSTRRDFESTHATGAPGPVIAPSVGAPTVVGAYGPPVWTNGKRAIDPTDNSPDPTGYDRVEMAAVVMNAISTAGAVGMLTWIVAEGL